MTTLVVGAYAAMPFTFRGDAALNSGFQREAMDLTNATGLEVPWASTEFVPDQGALTDLLGHGGEHVLTVISATMQHRRTERFGLASPDDESRTAAVRLVKTALDAAHSLSRATGRRSVRSILIQSAPWCAPDSIRAHADALRRSLDELLAWEWDDIELVLEHCDSSAGRHPSKGFLPIEVELDVLTEPRHTVPGMYINWGRSVLDTGTPDGAVEHALLAREAGLLRGLGISGVSDRDTPLGPAWSDSHLPVFTGDSASDPFSSTLLTPSRVQRFLDQLPDDDPFVIVKVGAPSGRPPLQTLLDSTAVAKRAIDGLPLH